MFRRAIEFIFSDPPNTFEFLRGWIPDTWLPETFGGYIVVWYFLIFQLPIVIWWLFFKKHTDKSIYPREDTPKSPVDYI